MAIDERTPRGFSAPVSKTVLEEKRTPVFSQAFLSNVVGETTLSGSMRGSRFDRTAGAYAKTFPKPQKGTADLSGNDFYRGTVLPQEATWYLPANPTPYHYASIRPVGRYSGGVYHDSRTMGDILTNPWGAMAQQFDTFRGRFGLTLQPGQSVNMRTGQLSDPNIHPQTARRLNEASQRRTAQQVGLGQAAQTSSRGQASVLATMDELYLGSQLADDSSGKELSGLAQARQGGLSTSSARTLLGQQAPKPEPKKPTYRF